jgi:polyferredoxin
MLNNKEIMRTKYPRIVYHIVLSLWIIAPLYIVFRYVGNITGFTTYSSSFSNTNLLIYYSLFIISAIFARTFGKSNTAHYICPFSPWMISMINIGQFLGIPSRSFITNSKKCIDCGICTKNCIMGLNVKELVRNDKFDQRECINCGQCITVCKAKAIECRYT